MANPQVSIFEHAPQQSGSSFFGQGASTLATGSWENASREEGLKRLRTEFLDEIRRDQRDQLLKRDQPTNTLTKEATTDNRIEVQEPEFEEDPRILALVKTTEAMEISTISLDIVAKGIKSADQTENLQALVILREKFVKGLVGVQEVVDANIIPDLLSHLDNQACYRIALESCWSIANICAGETEHVSSLVNKGLFSILPKLLRHPRREIFQQGAWAVGNIAADKGGYQYKLQKKEILEPLMKRLFSTKSPKEMDEISWVICNLVRNSEAQKNFQLEQRQMALPALFYLFRIIEQSENLDEIASTIVNLMDDAHLDEFQQNQIVERTLHILKNNNPSMSLIGSLLQLLNLISSGSDSNTDYLLANNVPDVLFEMLCSPKVTNLWMKRECLWILSNLVAGTPQQRSAIISKEAWVDVFFAYTRHENPLIVREAIWIMCNSTKRCTPEHSWMLARKGFLTLLKNSIESKPPADFLEACLESLNQILRSGVSMEGNRYNLFQPVLEESGILETLESLQLHHNQLVYERTINLIEIYFQVHDPVI